MAYPLTREQWDVVSRILARARRAGANRTQVVAAIETGLVESGLRNLPYGHADSSGWRQERARYYKNPQNVEASADRYFRETRDYLRRHGNTLPSVLSQGVQRSAFPERYAQKGEAARAILAEAKRRGLYVGHGTGGKQPDTKGSTKTVPGTPAQKVTLDPGADNSALRKQLLLQFIANRGKKGRVQEFALGWANAQDRPKQELTIPGQPAQTVETEGKGKAKVKSKFNAGPAWGGSQGVINPVRKLAKQFGLQETSRKRSDDPSGIGTASDHHVGNKVGYAVDFGTYNGAKFARAVAKLYGVPFDPIGTYRRHTFTASNGQRYSIQILWKVPGHHNHVHVGIRRV